LKLGSEIINLITKKVIFDRVIAFLLFYSFVSLRKLESVIIPMNLLSSFTNTAG
jgi:hypothetical protein